MEDLVRTVYGAWTTPKESAHYGAVALVVGVSLAVIAVAVSAGPEVFVVSALSVASSVFLISGWFAAGRGRRWSPVSSTGFVTFGFTVFSVGLLQEGTAATVFVAIIGFFYVGRGIRLLASKEG